jgi:hypothetical protein
MVLLPSFFLSFSAFFGGENSGISVRRFLSQEKEFPGYALLPNSMNLQRWCDG